MNLRDRALLKRALRRDKAKDGTPAVAPLALSSPMLVELLFVPPIALALMEKDIALPVAKALISLYRDVGSPGHS